MLAAFSHLHLTAPASENQIRGSRTDPVLPVCYFLRREREMPELLHQKRPRQTLDLIQHQHHQVSLEEHHAVPVSNP